MKNYSSIKTYSSFVTLMSFSIVAYLGPTFADDDLDDYAVTEIVKPPERVGVLSVLGERMRESTGPGRNSWIMLIPPVIQAGVRSEIRDANTPYSKMHEASSWKIDEAIEGEMIKRLAENNTIKYQPFNDRRSVYDAILKMAYTKPDLTENPQIVKSISNFARESNIDKIFLFIPTPLSGRDGGFNIVDWKGYGIELINPISSATEGDTYMYISANIYGIDVKKSAIIHDETVSSKVKPIYLYNSYTKDEKIIIRSFIENEYKRKNLNPKVHATFDIFYKSIHPTRRKVIRALRQFEDDIDDSDAENKLKKIIYPRIIYRYGEYETATTEAKKYAGEQLKRLMIYYTRKYADVYYITSNEEEDF